MANWLVNVLCHLKATWHEETSLFLENNTKIDLADIFYLFGEFSLATFHYISISDDFIHFTKLIARSVPVLKVPEKMYYSFFYEYICY